MNRSLRAAALTLGLGIPLTSAGSARATPPVTTGADDWRKGDDSCDASAPDCNVCAFDVAARFAELTSRMDLWQPASWRFDWRTTYAPDGLDARDVLDDGNLIQATHIQGFVATGNPDYPYAASHSDDTVGGILLIAQDGRRLGLSAIHAALEDHPSGLASLGDYVAYAEERELAFIDLRAPLTSQQARTQVVSSGRLGGGGVSLAKLRNGAYLLLTTRSGGNNETVSLFTYFEGPLPNMNSRETLASEDSSAFRTYFETELGGLPRPYALYSENLSLITECGTGDLYAVHATGTSDPFETFLPHNAIWRLSKVTWQGATPQLEPVDHAIASQNLGECHLRSAGTAHATADHELAFTCHERAREQPWFWSGDAFHFRVGK